MKKILSIAGTDCSGGAGMQADLKTFTAHKTYGMTVITALIAQNTTGVKQIEEASPGLVAAQMDAVFSDIYPDAVKIGMVSNKEIIHIIADKLKEYKAERIVLDPVMVATSGDRLIKDDAMAALTGVLMPLAQIITPNIPEAECLCGVKIHTRDDMQRAAVKIAETYTGAILIKGGHLEGSNDDLLYAGGKFTWFRQKHIDNPNTHGTGCTLSSAIACNLAQDLPVTECVKNAKAYVTGALSAGLHLGKGRGPLDHQWQIKIIY